VLLESKTEKKQEASNTKPERRGKNQLEKGKKKIERRLLNRWGSKKPVEKGKGGPSPATIPSTFEK